MKETDEEEGAHCSRRSVEDFVARASTLANQLHVVGFNPYSPVTSTVSIVFYLNDYN
jgi:hypothetical protein